jgi:hypothetical protein
MLSMLGNDILTAPVDRRPRVTRCTKLKRVRVNCVLRGHTLTDNDLQITQGFLAQMIGIWRTAAQVAGDLRADMITHPRARIHITDRAMIERNACERNAGVNAHYARIFD